MGLHEKAGSAGALQMVVLPDAPDKTAATPLALDVSRAFLESASNQLKHPAHAHS